MTQESPVPHSRATRWAHAGLSLTVAVELASGIIMQAPQGGHPVNLFYLVHEASDAAALALAAGFWAVIGLRRGGTEGGALLPWLSPPRLRALGADAKGAWGSLRRGRLPAYREGAPLTAASRGGLLALITAMALTGVLGEFGHLVAAAPWHAMLRDVVWVFLLGHMLLALLHHFGLDEGLAEMWSLRRGGNMQP